MASWCSQNMYLIIYVLMWTLSNCGAGSQTAVTNTSVFSGPHAGSRLAYYRWRSWLLNHEAILQKVPPVPYSFEGNLDKPQAKVSFLAGSILKLDETHQTVTMWVKFTFKWYDTSLALDEDRIESFTGGNPTLLPYYVTVPSDIIWKPNVAIVEGISIVNVMDDTSTDVQINTNGVVLLSATTVLSFRCTMTMTNYPFDSHHCPITLYAPARNFDLIPLSEQSYDDTSGGEWDITNITAVTSGIWGGLSYISSFTLYLQRKTGYYTVMIVLPMVLTSYLNVLVFILPLDLGDKSSYLVTLTVSMSVFTSFFNTDMPRGLDSLPWILQLLLFVYTEGFVILLTTFIILNKYQHEKQQGDDGLSSGANGSRVSPMKTAWTDKGNVDIICLEEGLRSKDDYKPKMDTVKMYKRKMTASQLDLICFVTALIVNSVGLGIILSHLI